MTQDKPKAAKASATKARAEAEAKARAEAEAKARAEAEARTAKARAAKAEQKAVAKKNAARSSRTLTQEISNPENVKELREALGKFYTVEDVSAALEVTTRTVFSYIRSGRIKAVKVAGTWRVSVENLRRFMNGE
ncbi:MAG: helix-turn-helix domain-containing protein [Synergistaceae bacterium]|jgi:excisionase family DNA binding protein|nr:helix-turn-helix domain-containing protein [Synergistaceae bacterium]